MKARVKATGRIIEVMNVIGKDGRGIWEDMSDVRTNPTQYHNYELDFIDLPKDLQHHDLDYWEKLKHQYAGMAMQGILSNNELFKHICKTRNLAVAIVEFATELVEKLKEKEEK